MNCRNEGNAGEINKLLPRVASAPRGAVIAADYFPAVLAFVPENGGGDFPLSGSNKSPGMPERKHVSRLGGET